MFKINKLFSLHVEIALWAVLFGGEIATTLLSKLIITLFIGVRGEISASIALTISGLFSAYTLFALWVVWKTRHNTELPGITTFVTYFVPTYIALCFVTFIATGTTSPISAMTLDVVGSIKYLTRMGGEAY